MKAKSCPSGKYWCFTDKKCKKIPLGYYVGARGYLYPENDDDGNSNGNGNGKNGNGNGGNNSGVSGSSGGSGSGVSEGTKMQENFKRINQNGQTYAVMLQFRGRTYNIQMFIPRQTRPTRLEVQKEVNKIYPGAIVRYFEPRVWDPANPALVMPEQMQPGAKDLVQQSDYMKPALQQKPKKKKHTCGEGVTLKKVNEIVDPITPKKREEIEKVVRDEKKKPDWMKVLDALKPKPVYAETFEIDKTAHKAAQKKSKMRNLAKGNTNPNEKAAAEKKAGGPKLYGEDTVRVEGQLGYVEFIDIIKPEPMKGIAERTLTKGEDNKKEDIVKGMKKSFKGFRDRYGDDAKSVMYATATKLAKEELAPHIKKGVAAAKPLVKSQVLQTGLPTTKEKPKPPEKKANSKSIFSQLTNKDEID